MSELAPDLARYDLSEADYKVVEEQLLDLVKEQNGDTVSTIWIPQDDPFASLVRTAEAKVFHDIESIMVPYEGMSAFLGIVDSRESTSRLVHGFRVTSTQISSPDSEVFEKPRGINLPLVQDIVDSEQDFTDEEFHSYYESRGVDLNKCMSVETNFRIGKRVSRFRELPISQVGYIAVFEFYKSLGNAGEGTAAIFTHLNRLAVQSLGAINMDYRPIAGREDLKTPTVGEEKFDPDYRPVEIPATKANLEIFELLTTFAAPTIYL